MSMGDKAGTGLSEEELLKKTEQRMAELSSGKPLTEDDDVDDDDTLEDDIDTDDDTGDGDDDQASDDDDDDDSTSDDDDDDSDADDTDDDDDDTDDGADGDDDKEIEISDAYYRAATNSGMTKDEIVDFMAANPKLAIKTFAKLHDNMNRVSAEYADFGRAKKKAAEDAANDDGGGSNTDKKSTYKKIDTATIREENPDNEALVDLIDQMQDQNATMHDQMEELRKAPVAHNNAEQEKLDRDRQQLIGTQIDAFFNDSSLAAFESTYGKVAKDATTWDELLPSEKVNRVAVIEQVEQLMEGAKALGKDMEVTDALERAHLMITQPIQAKMIREDIMKQVKKRSKGITLKPSSSKTSGKSTKKAKTDTDVVANAKERMDELFKRK